MLQKYYFATFVWVWNLVSHTKGTTPTESSQGAEEGVDLKRVEVAEEWRNVMFLLAG
jgi:hypothetical protein